ncbi:unnamed protein product [Penicillium salamii]|uniref:DNA topoisomerase (ATP-hydrolyzing) n=1 Tax=Penicillium salamii TaxID=1612424 RepID=A0A9W4NGM8_9EURO|nr:unnamed protein product [Penicillium salamii]CAG8340267.1 unnamed protein product [Penicillium salamii]CAG8364239.1 unnamed protein product [Penicillium salamii]CAG8415015.1 unnamed protein product [Penicillium salamii]
MASQSIQSLELKEQDASVREYIGKTLVTLVHGLALPPPEAHLSLSVKRRANSTSCIINPITGALEASPRVETTRTYSWPAKTAYEEWKFSMTCTDTALLYSLTCLYSGHSSNSGYLGPGHSDGTAHLQKVNRDIYYIDPEFFRAQYVVDGVIDDLAYTIGVDREALSVVCILKTRTPQDQTAHIHTINQEAAGKGLVAGNFRLIRASRVVVVAQSATEDTLIPRIENADEIEISRVRWVLVIEKEGKGYPDLSTRLFLRKLFDLASNRIVPLRFYALTDGDPHGIAITSTYKYGSAAHSHENARLSIPRLQWLGLRVSDIITVPEVLGDKALLSLTGRDRKKIISMLHNSPVWASDGPELQWRVELQRMLFLNAKAEIEILYECSGGLEGWIERRMFRQE